MSLILLRKLSLQRGHVYLSDPAEIDAVIDLKCTGWIDAEVGPFASASDPPKPHLFAIVRGLTQKGWEELKRLDGPEATPESHWDHLVSFTKRKFPHLKSDDGDGSAPF